MGEADKQEPPVPKFWATITGHLRGLNGVLLAIAALIAAWYTISDLIDKHKKESPPVVANPAQPASPTQPANPVQSESQASTSHGPGGGGKIRLPASEPMADVPQTPSDPEGKSLSASEIFENARKKVSVVGNQEFHIDPKLANELRLKRDLQGMPSNTGE